MGEETARLREEIEQTRGDLTRDVDRLADKTSPSRIVQRRVERTRGRFTTMKEKVMGAAPSPAGAAGTARDSLATVRDQAAHAGGRAQEAAHDAVSGVREQAEGNPLAAGVVAFGLGWLVSSLLPASEAETQVAQRAADTAREHAGPVLEQTRQAAMDAGEGLREHARDAAGHVRESAQEAAGTVREEARSAAHAGTGS